MDLLVVDDEMLARIGLRSLMDWGKFGYNIVGEADNGEKALILAEQFRPDVILLDICLPDMNGIEVIRELKKRGIKSKIIIVSCHDEFEYVKEAMKFEAFDYILKHKISLENVLNILNEIREIVEKEKKEMESYEKLRCTVEKSIKNLRKEFAYKILKGLPVDEYEYQFKSEYINGRNFCCILFEVDKYESIKKRYESSKISNLYLSIENTTMDLLRAENEIEFINYDDNLYVILLSNSEISENRVNERISLIVKKLYNAYYNLLNINVSFGVSDIQTDINTARDAFNKALLALSQKYIFPDMYFFHYKDLTFDENYLKNLLHDTEYALKNCIEKRDLNNAAILIKKLCQNLKSNKYLDINILKDFLRKYLIIFQSVFSFNDEIVIFIKQCSDINSVCDNLIQAMENVHIYEDIKIESDNYLIRKVVNYINSNIENDLNLGTLADHLCISKSYLSRIFNKEVNISISNYICIKRIEKSKVLLENSNYKNYEISEKVGFNNYINFNASFKKIVGCSPTEFKNKIFQKN